MMQTPNELMPDGLQMDLLWKNASPTSIFNGQGISLDLKDYKYIIAVFSYSTASDRFCSFVLLKALYQQNVSYADDAFAHIRVFRSISDSEVLVEACWSHGTIDNSYMIPYKIYGVK